MPGFARLHHRPTPCRARIGNRIAAAAGAVLAGIALAACGSRSGAKTGSRDWPLPNGDLASTRSLASSGIDRGNVAKLHVAWRFRFQATPGVSGDLTATPVVADGVVYLQDMSSTVFALDEQTGRLLWRHRFFYGASPGPNGVAVEGDRVYGATPTNAFALSAGTGRLLWSRRLITLGDPVIDVAPQLYDGIVFTSTIGLPPGGKGILYALDASTGRVVWQLSTIKGDWTVPREAGGGGAWYPPSIAGGEVYWGTANPYPYGGSNTHPNGGAYEGPALYTDSLLVTDAHTGRLIWFDQVTPHDVRDHDFQLSPILVSAGGKELAVGSGKGGVVIGWDRTTRHRLWETKVGVHENDSGPLPDHTVPVCPGLLGGVETPMATDGGKVFAPVVDLCVPGSADGYESLAKVDVSKARGELIALDLTSGRPVWTARFPSATFGCATVAVGVVFTSTLDGKLYALDTSNGTRLWTTQLRAGINSCPALAGNMLFAGAGVPLEKGDSLELDAFTT